MEQLCHQEGLTVRGHIVTKYHHARPNVLKSITVTEAAHPVPDKNCVEGTRKILSVLRKTGQRDLVVVLISGGGSALLCAPVPSVSLQDLVSTTSALLACGATITEVNAV